MYRPVVIAILIAALAVALASRVLAAETLGSPVSVTLNGRALSPSPPARVIGTEVALPSGLLSETFGFAVTHAAGTPTWTLTAYEHTLILKHGRREYTFDKVPHTAAFPALAEDGCLYVPVSILCRAFGYQVTAPASDGAPYAIVAAGSPLVDVRRGEHPDQVRIVLDLNAQAPFTVTEEDGKVTVEVPSAAGDDTPIGQIRLLSFDGDVANQVTCVTTHDRYTRIIVPKTEIGAARVSTLGDPPRILIDISRPNVTAPAICPPRTGPATPVVPQPMPREEPAIIPPNFDLGPWQVRTFQTAHGPVQAYVMVLDTRHGGVRIHPALAAATIMQRATVASIARREGATAAINGGYFDWSGPPLGILIINGEWIKPPIRNRSALGIMQDGSVRIGNLEFDGKVHFQGLGYLPVCGINQGNYEPDGVVVYTRRWGDYLPPDPSKTYVVVDATGLVQYIEWRGGAQNIPVGGYVVSGTGTRRLSLERVRPGMRATLSFRTAPEWPGLVHAVGAGPRLVLDGSVYIPIHDEQFDWDIHKPAKAHSAAGITRDGRLILFACETGLTLYELAHVMKDLGAYQAMKLDSGGSTTAVVGKCVLNHPTDGCPRAVSNAILIDVPQSSRATSARAPLRTDQASPAMIGE